MKRFFTLILLSFALLGTTIPMSFADETTTAEPSTESTATPTEIPTIYQPDFLPGPSQGTDSATVQDYVLNKAFPKALNIAIGIMGIAAFLGILIAALQMLTAYGDENKLTLGKTNMRYAIIGFLFIIFAYALVSIAVSVVLPTEDDTSSETGFNSSYFLASIPTAAAVDVEEDVNLLIPDAGDFIKDDQGRVSLPSGDFLYEIVPAVVTNVMYAVGFLIFIALIYGGTAIVAGRGNEEEVTKAKTIVTYAAISLGLLSLGYAIIYGISTMNLTQDETSTGDDLFTEDEL